MSALLELEGLRKAYPGVVANDNVGFTVGKGEVHALLGENGAGKSTLVKMVYGLVRPDEGRMSFDGQAYAPGSPHEARQTGIAMVFQHFSLFEALDVAENVALGMENPPPMGELATRIREVSETYGLPLDPGRLVGELSAGERQRVEIIRCLLQDPKLLIMDEPTSVLTPQEVAISFLKRLRKAAIGGDLDPIYQSQTRGNSRLVRWGDDFAAWQGHRLLRPPREIRARIGRDDGGDRTEATPAGRKTMPLGDVALALENVTGLSVASTNPFGTSLKDVSLAVKKGEILGIGGVAGNGQDELAWLSLSGEVLVPSRRGQSADARAGDWRSLDPMSGALLELLAAPGRAPWPCCRTGYEPGGECRAFGLGCG